MSLDKTLAFVRKLTALAEHPETSPAEAEAAREKADALMLKYAINEAMLRQSRPAAERIKPAMAEFAVAGNDMASYVGELLDMVAAHCRCIVRPYTHYDREQHCWMSKVYGYEHDLRFFEVLYTTLRLHMLGALRPKIDPNESLGENMYRIYTAGYNWYEIIQMYGWRHKDVNADRNRFIQNGDPETESSYLKITGQYRAAYRKEAAKRGESTMTVRHSETYRQDAAYGYTSRLRQRIREVERKRTGMGTELVLAKDDLEDWVREQSPERYTRCPKCEKLSASRYDCDRCGYHMEDHPEIPECEACNKAKSGHCRAHPAGSAGRWRNVGEVAYRAGVAHANKADLTGNKVSHRKTAIN
jgi:hypothetical protein